MCGYVYIGYNMDVSQPRKCSFELKLGRNVYIDFSYKNVIIRDFVVLTSSMFYRKFNLNVSLNIKQ